MVKIAIIGFGVVGSGVYDVIRKNTADITKNAGTEIDIKYILDIRDFSTHPESNLFVNDVNIIANDDEVKIVVETMGGLEPANTFTRQMLSKGKTVVTSNKELVATYGDELFELASSNGCAYFYEASVGGGIPIIRPLKNCLAANRIDKISGILNGTTNYILTRMIKGNVSFEDALKEAQEKGYAERNPSADVDGFDTGKKISILSSMINGQKVNHEDIPTEGITKITLKDIEYASAFGYVIKLIGSCVAVGEKYSVVVAPMLVEKGSPLAGVDDVFNGIIVCGNMLGEAMFYGRGAGKLPTASAVVADVIDAAKNLGTTFTAPWTASDKDVLININETDGRLFYRIKVGDVSSLIAELSDCFNEKISMQQSGDEIAFITPCGKLSDLKNIVKSLNADVLSELMILN